MGLTPVEFYSISPREFELMLEGFRRRRIDEYRLNRNLMFVMVKLWSSKPVNSPEELWDLGDKKETSEEEIEKLFEALRNKNG